MLCTPLSKKKVKWFVLSTVVGGFTVQSQIARLSSHAQHATDPAYRAMLCALFHGV